VTGRRSNQLNYAPAWDAPFWGEVEFSRSLIAFLTVFSRGPLYARPEPVRQAASAGSCASMLPLPLGAEPNMFASRAR
jgi:hypothetical protein